MSTKTIYVCEYCKTRSDSDLLIRISAGDPYKRDGGVVNWKIFIGHSNAPRQAGQFGQDAHLCSSECLKGWLNL